MRQISSNIGVSCITNKRGVALQDLILNISFGASRLSNVKNSFDRSLRSNNIQRLPANLFYNLTKLGTL